MKQPHIKSFTLAAALLAGLTTAHAQSGVWTTVGNGSWANVANWNNGSGPVADGPGSVADFSQINLSAARTITLDTSRTNGSLLFSDTAATFYTQSLVPSGSAVLTLDNSGNPPVIAVTNATAGISVPIAGTAGLTKIGPAQLNLNATNTFTGGLVINGGTVFDNFPVGGLNLLIPPSNDLTLSAGTFLFNCPANVQVQQNLANLTVNAGQSSILHTRGANGRNTNVFTGSFSRSVGGVLDIPTYDTTRTMVQSTSGTLGAGLVISAGGVPYITQGGFVDWSGKLTAGTAYLRPVTYTASTATTLAANANVAVATTTLAANTGIASLRNAVAQVTTINLGGFNLTNGGTLVTAAVTAGNGLIITNGTLLPPPNQDVVFVQNGGGSITVAATIADNGTAAALTKSAAGTLILASNNTFSGTVYLNAGTIQVGIGGTSGNIGTSALVQGQSGGLNFNRSDSLTFGGTINGPVTLSQLGSGTLTLTANSIFSGATTISAGTLQLGNGGTSGSISNSSGIANSGTLIFNRSAPTTYLGSITGNGAIVNQGSGSLTLPAGINGTTASVANTSSGSIVLSGINNYGGNTTISAGSLILGANASITNSPAITVASGALLDVSALTFGSLNLNGAALVKQGVYGGGVVTGNVATAGSSIISPATNGTIGTLSFSNNLTLGGGQLNLDITSSAVLDQIVVGGTLALNSGTLAINITGGPLPNGAYTVIKYPAGSLSGSINNLAVTFSQVGSIADLDDSVPGQIRLIVASATPNNLVWKGNVDANWDTATFNWLNGLVSTNYAQFDNVTFDDSATLFAVSLTSLIKPSQILVTNATDYTFAPVSAGNRLGGGASLVKDGSGQLTLLELNDYSGSTTIKAGTIVLGDNGANSGNLGLGNVTNNAALRFNNADSQMVSAPISGSGSLTNDGSGTTILAGNNSYSGATVINAGTLQVGLGGASGSLGTGGVTNNSTLIVNRSGSLALNNSIAGTGKLIVNGSGTVTLGAANAYLDNTYISNGVVKLGLAQAIPSTTTTPGSTGWLVLDGGAAAAGTLDLSGFNQTVNALSGSGGTVTGVITNSAASVSTNVLTVLNGGTTYNGTIKENAAGGKVQLVLRGSTELRLNGVSTFTAGTLVGDTATISTGVGGNIGAGGITLSNGTTLKIYNNGGTGAFVGNDVTIPNGAAATMNSTAAGNGYGGLLYGGASSTNWIIGTVSPNAANTKQYQNFLGTVQLTASGQMRFSTTSGLNNGGDNTTFIIDSGCSLYCRNAGAVSLGALFGSGSIVQMSDGLSTGTCTYSIGSKGIDSTFAGTISSTSPKINAINKVGSAKLTLSGTLSYDGATTVSAGTLELTGTAELDDSPTITIASNATLNVTGITTLNLGVAKAQNLVAAGTLTGNLSASSTIASSITPGTSGTAGTLLVSGDAALNDGTTNVFDFSAVNTTGAGVNDLVQVGGNLTLSGTVHVRPNFLNGGVAFGQPYTIMTYGGTLTGNAGNLVLDTENTPYTHLTATFSTSTAGLVTITFAGSSNLVWQAASTNSWQVGVVTNWFDGVSSNYFAQLDTVTFNDSASNFTALLVGTVTPNSVTVSSSSNYLFGGSGILGGSGGITKSGTGQLTITNAGGNTFNGTVTINGGVLVAGVTTALGSTNGSTIVTNTGALDVGGQNLNNEPVIVSGSGSGAGAILNSGALQQNALQFVTLAGDTTFGGPNRWDIRTNALGAYLNGNGYRLIKTGTNDVYLVNLGNANLGNVEIQQGRIGIQNNTVLGTGGTLRLWSGASVDLWNTTATNTRALIATNATVSSGSGTNFYGGSVSLNSTVTFATATPLQLDGVVSGSGALLKSGVSTLTLVNANTYTGNTTINGGILELAQSAPVLHTNSTVTIASGAFLKLTVASVTNQVLNLITNGVAAGNGLYSSANSAGYITGPGYLKVGSAQPAVEPIQTSFNPANGQLVLSWNNAGWTLQSQTNSLATGLNPNPAAWVNVTGATSPFTNTVTPANPTVFYRLMAP